MLGNLLLLLAICQFVSADEPYMERYERSRDLFRQSLNLKRDLEKLTKVYKEALPPSRCPEGHTGRNCDLRVCALNPCIDAECVLTPEGDPFCLCLEGRQGKLCQMPAQFVCKDLTQSSSYDQMQGSLHSSNYPNESPEGGICVYFIGAPNAMAIELTIRDVRKGGRLSLGSGPLLHSNRVQTVRSLPSRPVLLMGTICGCHSPLRFPRDST